MSGSASTHRAAIHAEKEDGFKVSVVTAVFTTVSIRQTLKTRVVWACLPYAKRSLGKHTNETSNDSGREEDH